MEAVLYLVTACAIFGAYLNSVGNPAGFCIWIATNIVFATNNFMIGQNAQGFLFLIYGIIAVNGIKNYLKLRGKDG